MSRRHALIFWGGFIGLSVVAGTPDLYLFARSSAYTWAFLWGYLYLFVEGKKSYLMPLLTRFYRKITEMETTNVERFYCENLEAKVRNLMSIAKSQMEYKFVHNEYLGIRNNTLLSFLINEQIALKNHVWERAESILKQAEQIEQMNQEKIINSVMSETLRSIDDAYNNNKEEIESKMFQLALEGIAKGRMDYANDPILPYVVETINKTVNKFEKVSK